MPLADAEGAAEEGAEQGEDLRPVKVKRGAQHQEGGAKSTHMEHSASSTKVQTLVHTQRTHRFVVMDDAVLEIHVSAFDVHAATLQTREC